MARSRNIKPAFFNNDELAELDPLARILFIGMWTIADFEGKFEWRSKRVKAQLLPYDDCDIEALAINLDKSGFIRFYSDGEKMYVKVVNFSIHQNPHKNEREKGSEIPEYCKEYRQAVVLKDLTINPDKSRLKRSESASDPADSLNLIPDSLNLIPEEKVKRGKPRFSPPTLEEVKQEESEKLYSVDPEAFFFHYEGNGWMVGKNKMKNWRMALASWNKRKGNKANSQGSGFNRLMELAR